jgi:glycerophosphoryl diester phosphodiesterase
MIFGGKPSVVGHRGFGAGEPGGYRENTMASYLAAVRHGLGWIELDAQRSLDGQLVIRHDPVTAGGDFIVTRSADELAADGILRLDDALAALPATVAVNIDVKTIIEDAVDPPELRTAALAAEALRRHAGQRRLLASSFDPATALYLKDHCQELPDTWIGLIAWVNSPSWQAIPAAANLGLDAITVHTGTLGMHQERRAADRTLDEVIDVAHRAGLEVMAWSPDADDAVRLAAVGADALCVNDVPGVLSALGR